jgi:hypothetical protein
MRIALASLLKNFELVPIEKELQEAQDQRQYITLSVRKNSLKVLIKPRSQQN